MKIVKLTKGNGEYRLVVAPTYEQKGVLRQILLEITPIAEKRLSDAVMGFRPGRNSVTAALRHVGRDWTVSVDLANFFDNVTTEMVREYLPPATIARLEAFTLKELPDRIALQGLPTSPVIANLAAIKLDKTLNTLAKKRKLVYTRYADDLTFSGNGTWDDARAILPHIIQAVRRNGFNLNNRKTLVQHRSAGYRTVLGISVGDEGIQPSRRAKRAMRASLYAALSTFADNHRVKRARGHMEWCFLSEPLSPEQKRAKITELDLSGDLLTQAQLLPGKWEVSQPRKDELASVARTWRIGKLNKALRRGVITIEHDGVYYTNDPIQVLGMSTLTTGWTSCMSHPGGLYRATSRHLAEAGAWLSYMTSGKEVLITGDIKRPRMKSRCLIWYIGGKWYFDRFYPGGAVSEEHRSLLVKDGLLPIWDAPRTPSLKLLSRGSLWLDSMAVVEQEGGRFLRRKNPAPPIIECECGDPHCGS